MNHEAIKLEARLAAIEYFTAEAFRLIYAIIGTSPEKIEAVHEHF